MVTDATAEREFNTQVDTFGFYRKRLFSVAAKETNLYPAVANRLAPYLIELKHYWQNVDKLLETSLFNPSEITDLILCRHFHN